MKGVEAKAAAGDGCSRRRRPLRARRANARSGPDRALAVAFAIGIPSCSALMADTVPRDVRGRVMAALGQGGILIGSAGGVGGPGVGFVTVIPLMLAYLAGGYLYGQNPAYPWFLALGATAIAILLIALFIRDPQQAEV